MLDWFFSQTLTGFSRLFTGYMLLFSGFVKLPDLKGFWKIVIQYGVVPPKLTKAVAYTQPFAELVIGWFLLIGVMPVLWSGLALLMMIGTTFFVYTGLKKHKALENCGCFGVAFKVRLTWRKFGENIIWILIALQLFVGSLL